MLQIEKWGGGGRNCRVRGNINPDPPHNLDLKISDYNFFKIQLTQKLHKSRKNELTNSFY
jgi:hypothetical protein